MRSRVGVMARVGRTTGLKAVAFVVAFASLTINFGLIDLVDGFTGYVDQARNQILDVGWGAVFGGDSSAWLAQPASPPGDADRRDSANSSRRVGACSRGCCWSRGMVFGTRRRDRRRVRRPTRVASGATDVPRAGLAPRADDARARNRCRWTSSRLCLADGVGPAARSSARRCCVQRSPPLDRDDRARAPRRLAHAPCRRSDLGLAHPGSQRVARGRRLGDLVPARTAFSSG